MPIRLVSNFNLNMRGEKNQPFSLYKGLPERAAMRIFKIPFKICKFLFLSPREWFSADTLVVFSIFSLQNVAN